MAKKIEISKAAKGEITKLPSINFQSQENRKYIQDAIQDRDSVLKNKDADWRRIGSFLIGK